MRKYNILQPFIWSETQNNFLKPMILFTQKSTILFSVILFSSLMKLADAILTEKLIQLDDPRVNKLLATHSDCSKPYKPKQFSLTRSQNCTQAPFEIEYTRRFASVFIRARAKRRTTFRSSATVQKNRVSRGQCSDTN